jgi:hypothetical protein
VCFYGPLLPAGISSNHADIGRRIASRVFTLPDLPSVPIQPLLLGSQQEYGMFEHFKRFPWVLKTYIYDTQEQLLSSLESHVIGPAELKAKEQNALPSGTP